MTQPLPQSPLTVVQLLPALNSGGVERGTLEVAGALVAAGHRAVVVSAGGAMVNQLEALGGQHVQLPIGRKSPGVFGSIPGLAKILGQAHIVHARSRLPAWMGRLALRRIKPQSPHWITTVHGLHSVGRYSAVMHSGERVICVSNTVRDYVLQNYPGVEPQRLTVIPRGVERNYWRYGYVADKTWKRAFLEQFPQLESSRIICLPGRLTRLKGHRHLVSLMADLQTSEPVVALIVGGGGKRDDQMRAELLHQAQDAGVAERLVFAGVRNDLREIMSISDLVLSLSERPEAFGRTVLEALSLGRPVAGFAHGGVAEILTELYPVGLVPPANAQRLADTVAALLDAPAVVPEKHNYELGRMLDSTLAVYHSLAELHP